MSFAASFNRVILKTFLRLGLLLDKGNKTEKSRDVAERPRRLNVEGAGVCGSGSWFGQGWRKNKKPAAERARKEDITDDNPSDPAPHDVEPATVRGKCSKRVNIVAVRRSYCVHRVRVGPQRRVEEALEGWHTNL